MPARRYCRRIAWERRHELIFALEINRAECEFLTGDLAAAEERLNGLSTRAATTAERASVAYLRLDLYIMLGQSSRAVAVGLEYLRHLGIEWSSHPTDEDMRREYERIWSTLADRPIEALVELPLMSDQASLATLDVLTKLAAPAWYTDANLASLIICRVVNLSLEGGNCDGSCYAYVVLGLIAGARFGDYESGFRFGRLGYDLVEQRGLKRFQARTHLIFGSAVMPWTRHIRAGRDLISGAFEAANKIGDRTFAGYCCNHLNTHLFAAGDPLDEVQREVERGLAFAQRIRFGLAKDSIAAQLALVRTLRGLTPNFGRLDDDEFTELGMERRFSDNPDLAGAEGMYWIRKLQARFFAGDYAAALEASERAQRIIWTRPSHFETAEYRVLRRALPSGIVRVRGRPASGGCMSRLWPLTADSSKSGPRTARRISRTAPPWSGPSLLASRAAIRDAMRLYEQAIHSARDNGFIQQ